MRKNFGLKSVGLMVALLFACASATNAQMFSTPQGAITNISFANQTNGSPVWVTIATAKLGSMGPWTDVKADCVPIGATSGWQITGAPYVRVMAEAKGGHALCNTNTYWKGTIQLTAYNGDYNQNMSLKINSLAGGATKLSFW